jgi:hypothetical protein
MINFFFLKKKIIFVLTKKKMFMRIKYGFILLLLLPFSLLFSQNDPQFTFFPWALPFYNPGAIGEKELHLNFTGVMRQGEMLISEDDLKNDTSNPESQGSRKPGDKPKPTKVDQQQILLNIDSYIKQIRGAINVTFLKDKNAYNDNIGFKFGYAAKIPLRGGKLGIGLQFGFLDQKPAFKNYKPLEPETFTENSESFLDFDMNFGLLFKTPTWCAGGSCTQVFGGGRIN